MGLDPCLQVAFLVRFIKATLRGGFQNRQGLGGIAPAVLALVFQRTLMPSGCSVAWLPYLSVGSPVLSHVLEPEGQPQV